MGKGSSDSDSAAADGDVVAICDIDQEKLEKASAKVPCCGTILRLSENAGGDGRFD